MKKKEQHKTGLLKFLKKQWSNLLILILIILLIVPQTRLPIQVFVNQLLSFEPDVIESEHQLVTDYHWPLQTLSGEKVNFSRSKGKVVLLNFWATWCAPCIAEMPSLEALYNEYGTRVDFYFVSSDKKNNIENFMRKNKYSFPVFAPLQLTPRIIATQALPTTYVIDKNGTIVMKEFGSADWNSAGVHQVLNRLLKGTDQK